MSTYYKNGNLQTIYRIAASRVTYERADGSIGELNLEGGGGLSDWDTLANKPAVIAAGATAADALGVIGALPANVTGLAAHNGNLDATTAFVCTPIGGSTLQRMTTAQLLSAFRLALGLEWINTDTLPVISNLNTLAVSRIGRVDAATVGVPNAQMVGAVALSFYDAGSNTGSQLLIGGSSSSYMWTRAWEGSTYRSWRQVTLIGPEIQAIEPATDSTDVVTKFNTLLDILNG